jgi:hypothetical protein
MPYCPVCKSAGRPEEEYTSHFVRATRDPDSEVTCPILKCATCQNCGGTGHTKRYCPNAGSTPRSETSKSSGAWRTPVIPSAESDAEEANDGFTIVRKRGGRASRGRTPRAPSSSNPFLRKSSSTPKPVPRPVKPMCKVCFDAGRPAEEYNSHYVRATRDPDSEVTCPILLKTCCEYCSEYGHTVKYCPKYDPTDETFGADADVKPRTNKNASPAVDSTVSKIEAYVRKLNDMHMSNLLPHSGRSMVEIENHLLERDGFVWTQTL